MTYEEKCKRLEEIVNEIESGKLSLDESSKQFEEGVLLIKELESMLNLQQGKITEIKLQSAKTEEEIE